MPRGRILVVDDEESVRVTLSAVLSDQGYEVTAAASGAEAVAQLRTEFDIVLTDLRLGDADGLRIVDHVRQRWPDTVSLVLTGFASVDSAIGALRNGAYDYLCKPCSPEELLATISRALERRQLSVQVRLQTRSLETAIDTARELHSALIARVEGTTALLREKERILETICAELEASLMAIMGTAARIDDQPEQRELSSLVEQIRVEARKLANSVNAALRVTQTESVEESQLILTVGTESPKIRPLDWGHATENAQAIGSGERVGHRRDLFSRTGVDQSGRGQRLRGGGIYGGD